MRDTKSTFCTRSINCIVVLCFVVITSGILPAGCSDRKAKAAHVQPVSKNTVRAALAYIRSETAEDSQQWRESLSQAEAALKDDPEHQAARMNAAWANWNLGKYAEAAELYGQVTGPARSNALLWRAHSLAAAENWTEAQAAYADRSAKVCPILWCPLALPGSETTDNADHVILFWKKCAKDNPKSTVACWMLGNAYAAAGRTEDAALAYANSLTIMPGWGPCVVSAAMIESNEGRSDKADEMLVEFLRKEPKNVAARWAARQVKIKRKDYTGASSESALIVDILGHQTSEEIMHESAFLAGIAGRMDMYISHLNSLVLWAGTSTRDVEMKLSTNTIESFDKELNGGAAVSAVERYELANWLYGQIEAGLGSRNMAENAMLIESLNKVNTTTEADLSGFGDEVKKRAKDNAGKFDFAEGYAAEWRAQLLPHLGRCERELQKALQEHHDFEAAKILLAEIKYLRGDKDTAVKMLQETLKAHPEATTIRLRLCEWLPLDKALELIEGVPQQDAKSFMVMFRRTVLERDAGNPKACAAMSLAALRELGTYWGFYEMLGVGLSMSGDPENGLECLEYSTSMGRSAIGALTLAKLRQQLGKPQIIEGLIDAWRASVSGSSEEIEATKLLKKLDTGKYLCGRCSGGGTISETSGASNQYGGSLTTYQVACPQCRGLGIWHQKAR